ncbi:chaperonin Cpn60/TCP-1 family [Pelagophyceae sp. CCMP2097]|nr:chaperonin Cpn60/TCP-1 family [Pelagophyceae sp. CCMP2097]
MLVLNANTQRDTGRSAQIGNISAAAAVADIVRSTLGPRAMLKMLLDPMGGIVITNDGNAILREVDVSHPAAKQMIELSRAQDEEVGDGTTSVIVLTGEMLAMAEPLLARMIHPTVIVSGYAAALRIAVAHCAKIATPISLDDKPAMLNLVQSCIGTKFSSRWGQLIITMAIDAALCVVADPIVFQPAAMTDGDEAAVPQFKQAKEVDIKRYAKIEKIPGGEPADSKVLRGVMFNKDVTHPRMRRKILRPRILLLDCPLEYKKGDSAANVEITKEEDWNKLLRIEEEYIENMCAQIVAAKPDIVITEKGVSDLAQHYLMKANITAFRRLRKTDNNRVARATGATIVNRTDEIQETDIGTGCGLFEVRKLGDEYYVFLEECDAPKACTLLLRGGSKDVLNEVERNLMDAMQVIRNVVLDPFLLPGGGATEMSVAQALHKAAESCDDLEQWPLRAVAQALEVIPRTLATNCGAKVVRVITQLKAKHLDPSGVAWGVDGETGLLKDMSVGNEGIWEPLSVKVQTIKTAVEAAMLILRIDDIVSGIKKKR